MPLNILITGSTSGIGLATARLLAAQGHRLWLLNRNPEKAEETAAILRKQYPKAALTLVPLDLNRLESVRTAAAELLSLDRIDVLINNAGGLTDKRYVTADGFEQQLQQNHLGHFLLTTLLLPLLLQSKGRVINLSSEAHRLGRLRLDDLQGEKAYNSFSRYAEVKLMNILFTRELHRRYHNEGLSAFALHPGVVNTRFGEGLGRNRWAWALMRPFLITPEKGAATSVFLATSAVTPQSGAYFKNRKAVKPAPSALDPEAARSLWEMSAALVQKR